MPAELFGEETRRPRRDRRGHRREAQEQCHRRSRGAWTSVAEMRSGFGGFVFGGVAPEDGGASFRRNDGVDGAFEDEDAVGDGKAERAAGAAFAGDDGDDGDAEAGHFAHIAGDGLGLAALFSTEPG